MSYKPPKKASTDPVLRPHENYSLGRQPFSGCVWLQSAQCLDGHTLSKTQLERPHLLHYFLWNHLKATPAEMKLHLPVKSVEKGIGSFHFSKDKTKHNYSPKHQRKS